MMSNVLDATNAPTPAGPRIYSTTTFADLLHSLGDIPADRVRMDPLHGTATFSDLVEVNEQRLDPICE